MQIVINDERTNHQSLEFRKNSWTGKIMILIDGEPLYRVKRNRFSYITEEGEREEVFVQGNELTGITIEYKNQTIPLLRKLEVYEYVLSFLPFFLLFFGAIGGLFAALSMFSILTVIRKTENIVMKVVVSLGITALGSLVTFIIGTFILELLSS